LGGIVLSLLLSWGKNFPALTNFMIDYFPLYNKFRAVSSIQVVLELCFPVLAALGLNEFFKKSIKKKEKLRALKRSILVTALFGIFILGLQIFLDFEGQNDDTFRRYFGDALFEVMQNDRKAVYTNDTLRSLIYVLLAAFALWLFLKEKINKNIAAIVIGVLCVLDLGGIAKRYVNEDDFVRQRQVERPFQETDLDKQMLADTSVFRVFNPSEGLNGARTSYFHKSIGGYHAAKPAKMQDLVEFHLYKNNLQVLNMLNVKYIIQEDEEGRKFPGVNPDANGNAWFVSKVLPVSNSDEAITALGDFNSKIEVVVDTKVYPKLTKLSYVVDSLARIKLVDNRPNYLKYEASNKEDGFAVFSEMHYPKGWQTYLNGKKTDHLKVNYALRGMQLPAGTNQIEFKFEPEVVETGSKIALAGNILLGLIIIGGIVFSFLKSKRNVDK